MNKEITLNELAGFLKEGIKAQASGDLEKAENKYQEILSFENRKFSFPAKTEGGGQNAATVLKTIFSQTYNNLGLIMGEEGKTKQALDQFRAALDYAPGSLEAHTNLARFSLTAGNIEQAIDSARNALKLQDDFVPAVQTFARACILAGSNEEAMEALQKVEPATNKNPALANTYGVVLEKLGRFEEALEKFKLAVKISPDRIGPRMELGNLYLRAGKYIEACNAYREILKIEPNNVEAQSNLGFALHRMGHFEDAEKYYKAALTFDKDHVETLANYASFLWQKGEKKESANLANQVLNLPKISEKPLITAANIFAKSLRMGGKPEEAIKILTEVHQNLNLQKGDHRLAFEMAENLDETGNYDQAFELFTLANQDAVKKSPGAKVGNVYIPSLVKDLNEHDFSHLDLDKPEPGEQAPVFLAGFLESGAFLTERILNTFPALETRNNSKTLNGLRAILMKDGEGYPDVLHSLTDQYLSDLKKEYLKLFNKWEKPGPEALTISGYPMNFVDIPLILKMFPTARFIYVYCHPLDACLNCFFHGFALNRTTTVFSDLNLTAQFYADCFDLWEKYKKEISFDRLEVNYNHLLQKPEKETRKILKFIEKGTGGKVDAKGKNKPDLEKITEEAAQTFPPERWKNYRAHLEDAREILAPCIEKLDFKKT